MNNSNNMSHLSSFSQMETGVNFPTWLNQAVFYQIYPQSFYDTNGDGIGDIPGIIQKLDYLQWLGVNAIWINPCFVSPFQDAGYDVADYYRIAPCYGTNRDLYRLCREAHRRGIRVCLDLVAGHTSIDHPWFKASCLQRKNKYSDRYIWAPSETSDANMELSFIKGYYERDESYIANCFDFQPALNYGFARPAAEQPWQQSVDAPGPLETRKELIKIMNYWLDHGVDGFRVDMAFSLVKLDPGHQETIKLWQDIGQEIRTRYPDMALISEWGNPEKSIVAGFDIDFMLHFGVSGYPDLILNKNCFFRRSGGASIGKFLESYLELAAKTEAKGLISVPSANHDIKRPRADGRTIKDLKVIFTFLLTWPGVPFIYYGDEIGMRYMPKLASKEGGHGRTGSRTPMQWDDGPNSGFSTADKDLLYLPLDPHRNRPTVEKQASDSGSLLNHVRKLIALRTQSPALQATGTLTPLPVKNDNRHFAYLRQSGNERFLIVLNPSAEPSSVRINGIKPDNLTPLICHGTQAGIEEDDIQVKMAGVSYGVFKL
ncbi:alpha-amylase family glycosyl hydrolase [Chloroflexota bacterium]